ncbi:hypothetical protein NP493_166g01034 [Ridgeia piscesae]|uniref:KY-like immunoglobulin-like domain-containing protein n=1 Tax=Ridgeia piscesae TaxID=27915 RepID=A0AAD9P3D9_RIDPI|nr:hypothetical protein NP493_166g01034 [Ridgeia piscesae]
MLLFRTPGSFLYGSYETLAVRVTKQCRSDVACARALFHWMTSLDCTNIDAATAKQLPGSNTPMEGLLNILCKENCHAHFFARLASAAGIACVIINGVVKNGSYVVGERDLHLKRERRAQWNAILVDGEWRLLDVLWASCALVRRRVAGWALIDVDGERLAGEQEDDSPGEKRYHNNEFFFLTDPDQFVCTHLPDDSDWQLLPQPLFVQQFETFFYIRERFFDLGLTMVNGSQRRCVLKTTDAEVTIKFGIPASLGSRAQFRYMLFRQKTAEEESGKAVKQTKGCVIGQLTASMVSYTCHMAEVGRYRFDVFGRDLDRHNELDLVCSYVIECDSTDGRYLPDDPEIGWGPGTELDDSGLVPNSHFEAIVYTDEPELTIRFYKATHKKLVFWQCLKHLFLDEMTLMSRAVLRMCGDYITIVVRLPQPGEYAYELFCDQHNSSGLIPNVCNYLIRFYRPVPMPAPFPPLLWGVLGRGIHALKLNVKTIGQGAEGYIKTSDPEVKLRFNVSQSNYEFFYEIGCQYNAAVESAAAVNLDIFKSHVMVHVTLPETGEYGFNVFVRPRSRGSSHLSPDNHNDPDDTSGTPDLTSAVDEAGRLGVELSFGSTNGQDVSADDVPSNATEVLALEPSPDVDTEARATLSDRYAVPFTLPTQQRCPTEICVTTDDVYRVTLPRSEHSLMLAAERRAAQHPVNFVRLQRKRDEAFVSLPLLGVYVVDVFEVHDRRRLKNVHRLTITRNKKVRPTFN